MRRVPAVPQVEHVRPDWLAMEGERDQTYDFEPDADAGAEYDQPLEEGRRRRLLRNLHSRLIVQTATPNLAGFQGCHLFHLLAGPRSGIRRSCVHQSPATSRPGSGG
jgi:hypothetical protein